MPGVGEAGGVALLQLSGEVGHVVEVYHVGSFEGDHGRCSHLGGEEDLDVVDIDRLPRSGIFVADSHPCSRRGDATEVDGVAEHCVT